MILLGQIYSQIQTFFGSSFLVVVDCLNQGYQPTHLHPVVDVGVDVHRPPEVVHAPAVRLVNRYL